MNTYPHEDLPQRRPGGTWPPASARRPYAVPGTNPGEAETVRITVPTDMDDEEAQRFRDALDASTDGGAHRYQVLPSEPATWHTLEGENTPPWNSFDTFLRRALMIGGAAIVWAVIVGAVLMVFGMANVLSDARPSYVEQPLINTTTPLVSEDEPGIYCETYPADC